MLQRSVQRSLHRQWSSIHPYSHVCACRCGRQLPSPNNTHQRRSATSRAAPSTYDRQTRLKRRALSAEDLQENQKIEGMKHDLYYEGLQIMYQNRDISVRPDDALDFLNGFDSLLKSVRGQSTPNPDAFQKLLDKHGVSLEDCRTLSRDLLVSWGFQRDRNILGKKLLLSASRAGSEEATINVVGHAVVQQLTKPGTLRAKEIQHSREHLQRIAASGHNYRAMVLQGRVAEVEGDPRTAITMWTNAMAAAVEASAEEQRLRKAGITPAEVVARDPFELNSPWIDLFHIHRLRGEARQANWALEIGCQQDDPDAHYLYANYTCLRYSGYDPMYTSEWLYHMTKAATSGQPKAAYELAEYYAESSWKYVEDEPPDDLKPTPFDSYPASGLTQLKSRVDFFLTFIGLKPITRAKHEQIWHNATFPNNAVDRFRMALEWCEMSSRYGHAPAYLLRAKICMQKTIDSLKSSPRDIPQAALELKDERYTYKSKADYEAGVRKETLNEDEEDAVVQGPPNPWYSLEAAQRNICEVFYAYEANRQVIQAKARYARERRQGLVRAATDEEDIINEDKFKNWPMHIRKWVRNPEVREQYEDKIEDLHEEAKEICDAEGWDLYGDDGGLVYRAQRVGSGKAAAAAAA